MFIAIDTSCANYCLKDNAEDAVEVLIIDYHADLRDIKVYEVPNKPMFTVVLPDTRFNLVRHSY
jgi:hypothetical protein